VTKRKMWRYYCGFCRKKAACHPTTVKRHEVHCFLNPNRIPYLGEMTSVKRTGKDKDFGWQEDMNCHWYEWVPYSDEQMPAWWPGEGKIFDGKQWHSVSGYSIGHPTGAHGYAGGPPPYDIWPEFEGKPLNEFTGRERLHHLRLTEHGKSPTISGAEIQAILSRL